MEELSDLLKNAKTLSDAWKMLEGTTTKAISAKGGEFLVKEAKHDYLIVEFDVLKPAPVCPGYRVTYQGILPFNSEDKSVTIFYFPN